MTNHDIGTAGLLTMRGPPLATREYDSLIFTNHFKGVIGVKPSCRGLHQEHLEFNVL